VKPGKVELSNAPMCTYAGRPYDAHPRKKNNTSIMQDVVNNGGAALEHRPCINQSSCTRSREIPEWDQVVAKCPTAGAFSANRMQGAHLSTQRWVACQRDSARVSCSAVALSSIVDVVFFLLDHTDGKKYS